MTNKSTTPTIKDIDRKWHLLDAEGQTLGRLASEIAKKLIAKHKANFSYHFDNGDYVVVVNAAKISVTGNKQDQKKYYSHSGYTGNLKEINLRELLAKDPTKVIKNAVKGMLPKNKLGTQMLSRLKVFMDDRHPYQKKIS